ncbi:MAG: 3-hydroxyacyl-CoA dehydrogenase family protein [Chloroflexi bacterium]|nr:3-hydroxyacyl-CoA dehydrogenase family protein [Chloroflexota bacterium]
MKLDQVKKIGILGGGVMGGGIGQVLATHGGFEVVIRDINDEIVRQTRESIVDGRWGIKRAVEIGKLEFDTAAAAMERLTVTTNVNAIADCDFVIEAIPERLDLKQQEFAKLDGIVKPDAIFTSNTSGFVIAEIARDVSPARKALFAGMHFSNPVPTMRMCEVIYTPETTQETIDTVSAVAEKAGKVVCMVKDEPGTYGFILNRIFAAAHREADKIVDAGIASREDVDKAMMTGRNWPSGFYGQRGGIGRQW